MRPPGHATRIDPQGVALLDVVVEHGGQQVVGVLYGMEVAGEVQVDVLHGDELGIATTSRAALYAEDGTQGGLAQSEHRLVTEGVHGVGQSDGGGGLALAGGRGIDGGHEDELGLLGLVGHLGDVHLGHVVAVGDELVVGEAQLLGNLANGPNLGLLCDLDV